ncbi:MAG TPA: hypothetical protein VK768_03760 [Chthoniobacterales bacterium]|jgi:hypothetical protein|nr:hypothetical protein [Chthoniobacterales bacterium]
MKTKSISRQTAQVHARNNLYPKAGDPQTPAVFMLHGLKKLVHTITTKHGRRIYRWPHFWRDLSTPFYGHTKVLWPGYLALTFVSRRLPRGILPGHEINVPTLVVHGDDHQNRVIC